MTHSIHPFDYLEALELCAVRYSSEMPEEQAQTAYWEGVGFKLNSLLFTVGISEISEILPVPQVTPLPGVKPWAKGVANIHGRLIPITDLREFFGLSGHSGTSSNRIIIIDRKEISVGLVVDEVHGRQRLPASDYQEVIPGGVPDNILPFTSGCYQQEVRHIVFNVEQLVASNRFLAAASE